MKSNIELRVEAQEKHDTWLTKNGGFAKDMTMRDEFAGRAMQGLIANGADSSEADSGWNWFAGEAYSMADAMLKARAK
jgi:hypothetical protein